MYVNWPEVFLFSFFQNALKKKEIYFEISWKEGGQGMAKVMLQEV